MYSAYNPPGMYERNYQVPQQQAFERPLLASEMTLRDYFAAQWLQGWATKPESSYMADDKAANRAYRVADAMMKARNQE